MWLYFRTVSRQPATRAAPPRTQLRPTQGHVGAEAAVEVAVEAAAEVAVEVVAEAVAEEGDRCV
jgi:hypothetical protein